MSSPLTDVLATASGGLVGLTLGLVGGGGSLLAAPLLVYGVGIGSPHVAIGTSAVAVSASAFANLVAHARAGNVKWPCAVVFTLAGMLGALAGSNFAKAVDGQKLLVLFGLLMLGVGVTMFRRRSGVGDPQVRLSRATASRLAPQLIGSGLGVGLLSGFFGIGGGFLIVPGLMFATRMPLSFAIGTSLVAVTAFGATTAANYAASGLIDWRVAALFIIGGVLGGWVGITLGRRLSGHSRALGLAFAAIVSAVGVYVSVRGILALY